MTVEVATFLSPDDDDRHAHMRPPPDLRRGRGTVFENARGGHDEPCARLRGLVIYYYVVIGVWVDNLPRRRKVESKIIHKD